MEDHSSDILGGRLPVQRHHSPSLWPNTDSNGKLYLGFALVVFLSAWLWLKPYWYAWRNERYRIQVRRRHGIPDDDRRPFSVAFAAVNARKQRDAKEKESRESQEDGRPPSSSQARSPLDGQVQEEGPLDPYVPPLFHPQAYNKGPFEGAYREPNGLGAASTLSTNGHPEWSGSPVNGLNRATSTSENSRSFFVPGQLNTPGREDTSPILESSRRSHVREEALPDSEREAKKSRVQEEAPYEGDDTLETDEDMAVDQTPEAPRRGAKRAASPEYDEGLDNARYNRRDKRARKVSHETYHGDTDHSMDSDDDQLDDEMEADAPFRGRKRDRVEAGSSFGGDDSFLGEEDEKARRHRKRRTLGHRKAEPTSRGKKRSRAAESDESDGEQSDRPRKQASRRKRGKRSPGLVDEDDMDVDEISQDPLCKGRHVGEEWESHGTRFKVGLNGQRLRLELVKRSRTRFPMPKDSQHPDKEANIDIYVETWLTEDEYKSAKEKRELAWQAPTKREQVPHSLDIPESPMSPSKIGKGLLWMADASDVPESPLPQRGPFKQSTASNVGIRSNPFEQSTMTPIRRVSRISSVYQASAPASAPESPKLTASKSYSKWEKQDLEAAAMSRIREKLQREANKARVKEIPAAETKPAVETRSAFTAKTDAPTAPATGPTFSFAKPADKTEEKAAEKPSTPASNTFNAPKTTTPFSFPPAPAASSAPSEQSKPATNPPAPAPLSTGEKQASAAPPAPSPSPFSFGNKSDPTPAPSSSVSAMPLTIFGAAAKAGQPATTSTASQPTASSKPTFSFGAPPSAATPTPPSAFGAPSSTVTTIAPKSVFGAPSTSSTAFTTTSNTTTPQSVFGGASTETKKPEQSSSQSSSSGPSLLSRLGPAPTSNAPIQSNSTTALAPSTSTLPFALKPSSTGNVFGSQPKAPTPMSTGDAAASTVTTQPKFSFGFPSKPATPATSAPAAAPASTAVSSSTGNADGSKPTFFGAPKMSEAPSSTPAPTAPATSTSQPKFNFGVTSQPAASAPSNVFGGASSNATAVETAPKSAFGFGASSGSSNPFLAAQTNKGTPVFGSAATDAAKTADSSKPAEGSKPTFSFGVTNAPTSVFGKSAFGSAPASQPSDASKSTEAAKSTETSKPVFSFAGPSSSSTPATSSTAASQAGGAQTKSPFSFNFGGAPSTSSSTSAFGAAAPNAPSSAINPPTSVFGASATPNTSSPFGGQSVFGKPSQPSSPFGTFGSGSTNSGAFGFGAPSGSSSNPNTDQSQKQ